MGYESRVYIVERYEVSWGKIPTYASARIIAHVDLCRVGGPGYEAFFDAFDKEIDYKLFIDDRNHDTDTDMYGDHLKSAKLEVLLTALKEAEAKEHYRRFTPLIAMLEVFSASNKEDWDGKLEAVHYGY